ncbi:hypothetical protein ACJX0J_023930, partial [Zea mays]
MAYLTLNAIVWLGVFIWAMGALFSALAYRCKWLNEWAKEWFYMKNDLKERTGIKGIIQTPIHACFGYEKLNCYINFEAQAAIVAFNMSEIKILGGDFCWEDPSQL